MKELNNESDIIEALNSAPTVRGFFNIAVNLLTQSIDALVQRIFRKDDFAVQTVVEPLLNESGPLGEILDRSKLLFAIGILPEMVYHDIEDIIQLQTKLNQEIDEHTFTDHYIINSLQNMTLSERIALPSLNSSGHYPDELEEEFNELQIQRQQQVIKSGLSLVIIEICEVLNSNYL
ncbi:MltR family transcriptional regulator [Vibrio albus]|uniref:MltR family transcriptional regulator n=1 Tax=Vibrio albus TaxID=2200953 RepID=A0A2U3BAN0_9VIBR|nr:MltR family transcriptional regulator [Vibrio albus]PWI33851.1 MltR family transcriptional regulator [Vibrio albus]